MTHSEATKQLMELQVIWNRGNDAEAVEYNKHILDTINYFITQTVPLSVIEKIKAEIKAEYGYLGKEGDILTDYGEGLHDATKSILDIIDQAIKECDTDE